MFSYAHTLVGVGCMVVNPLDEILVVQASPLSTPLLIEELSQNIIGLFPFLRIYDGRETSSE